MKCLISLFVAFSLLVPAICFGDILTLKDAVQQALEKSPEVQQLQEQLDSARAKKRLALAPTEPTLQINDNDLTSLFHLSTAASNTFQLTQPIGFPGRAFLSRSQLNDQADSVEYQLRATRLQVSTNVKTSYYNLQLAIKNIQLNQDTRIAYERILEIAKRRYESGATAQVDFLNAQVALYSNQNELSDLQTSEKMARAQLNVFFKNPTSSPLEIEPIKMVDHRKVDFDGSINQMIDNRNEIKSAQSLEQASRKAYDLAWMSVLPDFQLTVGTTFYRNSYTSPYSNDPTLFQSGNWATHTYMVGLQFTVPIWFLFNEREVITGASHDRVAAERNLDVLYNQSKTALELAVDTISSTKSKIENFEKHLLPLSEQSLNLALIDYSSGKIDFQTLSDTAAVRRQARLNYAQAVVTYLTSYAVYGQLIGEDL